MRTQQGGLIRQHQSKLALFYRISDVFIIWHALFFVCLSYGIPWGEPYIQVAFASMILFYLFGESVQLYHSWRGAPIKQYLQPVIFAWLATVAVLLILGYITKTTGSYSRIALGLWALSVLILLMTWRLLIRYLLGQMRSKGYNSRKVAIAGANDQGARLAELIQQTPSLGYKLVGFFDDRHAADERTITKLPAEFVGDFDELVKLSREGDLDHIYIALSMKGEERINQMITALADTTASVYIVPDFFAFNLLSSRWINVGDIPTVSIYETPFFGVDGWVKRLEDVVIGLIILAVIAAPMLLIAIVIKLTSPGPILFKQRRYGLDGRKIKVWKFRTMTVTEDDGPIIQAKKNDARVTKFGAFLRRTSLDELPQFFNVLAGDMSIVGPRPHAIAHNEEYRKLISGYMLRHKVKPGITGWAQINGWRGETDCLEKMSKRVEHDLWYIRSWSIMLDIRIIMLSIVKGFVGAEAY